MQLPETPKGCDKPCSACPFARHCEPGGTGGGSVVTFAAQAELPYWLPCHQSPGYGPDNRSDPTHLQCGGAAIFRANTGVAPKMPDQLHALPADAAAVFATPGELIGHHMGLPAELADLTWASIPKHVRARVAVTGLPGSSVTVFERPTKGDV